MSSMSQNSKQHRWSVAVLYSLSALAMACGEEGGAHVQGDIDFEPARPALMNADDVATYTGSNEFVLEAQALHRSGLDLHRNVIIRTCGPTAGVCHNQKEYPDLHTPANLLNALDAPCNVQSEWDAVFDRCELPGDRFALGDSREVEIGYIQYIPGESDLGDDEAPTEETPGLHIVLHDPLDFGDRNRTWGEARFMRSFVDAKGDVNDLTFAYYQSQFYRLEGGTHLYAEVREYQVDRVNELLSVGVEQGDMNRNGIYGAQQGQPLAMLSPGRPEESYLVGRLRGELADQKIPGTRMPLANEPLTIPDMLALYCFIEGVPALREGVLDLETPINYADCQAAVDPEGLNLLGNGATWLGRVQPLLEANCGGCHGGDEPQGGFDLLSDGLYERLLEPSTQVPDMPYVTPGDPMNSYLWLKLTSSEGIVGLGMPVDPLEGVRVLPDGALADIETWIDNGALAEE